jgi:hypothetical protein
MPAPAAQAPADTAAPAAQQAQKPRRKPPKPAVQALKCEGPFARDTSEAKLAEAFGANNVVFTQVDGPEGSKLNASVVFPSDPKRRLEVLWHDESARQRPSAFVINGASTWVVPTGLRIGSALAEVEKQNGKPFKLSGFDWDLGGTVTDWQGGALTQLPGGCSVSARFQPDPKAPAAARGKVLGDREFLSSDANMRAVRPKAIELLVGYGE